MRMPEHVATLEALGAAVLALAAALWVIGLVRVLRRARPEAAEWHADPALGALPGQRRTGPHLESVPLTPAEQDAFAGLVRRLDDGS